MKQHLLKIKNKSGIIKGFFISIPIALLRMYSSRKNTSVRGSPAFPASVTARRENNKTINTIQLFKIRSMAQLHIVVFNSFAESKLLKESLRLSFNAF